MNEQMKGAVDVVISLCIWNSLQTDETEEKSL